MNFKLILGCGVVWYLTYLASIQKDSVGDAAIVGIMWAIAVIYTLALTTVRDDYYE